MISLCLRYNVAVGDGTEAENFELHFNTNKGNGQALAEAALANAISQGVKIQSVHVATVDFVISSEKFALKPCPKSVCNRFFVMKVDVEGFELRALRGSAALFKHAPPPIIMIELAPGTIKGAPFLPLIKSLQLAQSVLLLNDMIVEVE